MEKNAKLQLKLYLLTTNSSNKMLETLKEALKRHEKFVNQVVLVTTSPFIVYQLRREFPNLICGLWMDKTTLAKNSYLFKTSAILMAIYMAIFRNMWVSECFGTNFTLTLLSPAEFLQSLVLKLSSYTKMNSTRKFCHLSLLKTFIELFHFHSHISALWRGVGIRPIVYTVNSPNEKRYFQQVVKTQYLTDSLRSEPQIIFKAKAH